MGICVPKHVVCNWYTPTFAAGTTPCLLQETNETRSRRVVGGTFFRSVDVGTYVNNIQVESIWQVDDGGWRDYNTGAPNFDTLFDVVGVKLNITDGAVFESYTASQPYSGGSPAWLSSAIPSLRSQLSSSVLVTMPANDVQEPWNTGLDDDHLAEFSLTNLSGGTGGPITAGGLDSLRTGPAQTLIYIKKSEINNSNGTMDDIQITRYWNGTCWKTYDPLLPDCEDPNNPPDCSGTGCP